MVITTFAVRKDTSKWMFVLLLTARSVLLPWLKSQSTYQLQKPKKETHEEPPLKLQCPKNVKYYSFQEIQTFYGISRPTLDSWVLKEGIPTMKLGRVKRIQKDAFDEVLKSKRKVEEDV